MRDILVESPLKAVSNKGNQRIRQILLAALEVLIRHGYHAFTMREVAAECNISVGNLNYYYRSKAGLLSDLIDSVWRGYEVEFDRILHDSGPHDPEHALEAAFRLILDDLATRETTVFFPELWAMANHDADAAKRLDQIYGKVRQVFIALIPQINPTLSEVEISELALFLSASLEGQTMFVGYRKPWSAHRKQISNIAVKGLLDLVRNLRPEHCEP